MDNTLVSARVSRAKKDAVCGVLGGLGFTTSDLINNAFDYVLEKGKLPLASSSACNTDNAESMRKFKSFVQRTTLDINWENGFTDGNYKELIAEGRRADYESLA